MTGKGDIVRHLFLVAALLTALTVPPAWGGSVTAPEFAYSHRHVTYRATPASTPTNDITLAASSTIYTDGLDVHWGDTCALAYRAWDASGGATVTYTIALQAREHGIELTTSNAEAAAAGVTVEVTPKRDVAHYQPGDLVTIVDSDGTDEEDCTLTAVDVSTGTVTMTLAATHIAGATIGLKWVAPASGSAIVTAETDEERHIAHVSIPLCGQIRLALTEGAAEADTDMAIRWLEQ